VHCGDFMLIGFDGTKVIFKKEKALHQAHNEHQAEG
jgi:hypothetical protein